MHAQNHSLMVKRCDVDARSDETVQEKAETRSWGCRNTGETKKDQDRVLTVFSQCNNVTDFAFSKHVTGSWEFNENINGLLFLNTFCFTETLI